MPKYVKRDQFCSFVCGFWQFFFENFDFIFSTFSPSKQLLALVPSFFTLQSKVRCQYSNFGDIYLLVKRSFVKINLHLDILDFSIFHPASLQVQPVCVQVISDGQNIDNWYVVKMFISNLRGKFYFRCHDYIYVITYQYYYSQTRSITSQIT